MKIELFLLIKIKDKNNYLFHIIKKDDKLYLNYLL